MLAMMMQQQRLQQIEVRPVMQVKKM